MVCEAEVVLEAFARRETVLSYTSDLYLVGNESECEWRSYQLPRALRSLNGNLTQSESLLLSDLGLEANARVADLCGSARIEQIKPEAHSGRCVVSGRCRYTLVIMNEGEMTSRRKFCDIPKEWGLPDGMTLDENDNLWVALWTGDRR